MQKSSGKDEGLLYMSLNQDQTCLVVGTEKGFKLYDTIPFKLRYQRGKFRIYKKNKFLNFSFGRWYRDYRNDV